MNQRLSPEQRVWLAAGVFTLVGWALQWWLIASGDQGTTRPSARALSRAVRRDGRYEQVQIWPWSKGRQLELWRRKPGVAAPSSFEQRFIALARGLEQGPRGLQPVFAAIGL